MTAPRSGPSTPGAGPSQRAAPARPSDRPQAARVSLDQVSRPAERLPVPTTPLIGREAELALVLDALADPAVRLVTLVGPAGSGKSRLALEVATIVAGRRGWRAAQRDLGSTSDPDFIDSSVAAALGAEAGGGRSALDAIAASVGRERTLLILDGAERVRDAAAPLVELLEAAPGLRILATSRRPLRIASERLVRVDPLPIPPAGMADPELVAQVPTVRLFLERARTVRPDLEVRADTAELVAAICRRLDGLPLTIELAAGSLRTLTLRGLLDRLEASGGDGRTVGPPLRDGSADLSETMDRSVALLGPELRRLYARLGVFAGAFDQDLAAAMLRAAEMRGITPLRLRLGDALDELVDASLLRRTSIDGAAARYGMAGIVRADAIARLVGGREEVVVRWAHAYALLELAEAAAARLADQVAREDLDLLDEVEDDLRAAFDWARIRRDGSFQLRLAVALADFWGLRGHFAEGRMRLTAALQHTTGERTVLRARGLDAAGALAYRQADLRAAGDLATAALELAQELGEPGVALKALYHLGVIAMMRGEPTLAEERFEGSLLLSGELGSDADRAIALNALGSVLQQQGRLAAARARFGESLAIKDRRGDIAGRGLTLANIGLIERDLGELDAAGATLDESAAILRTVGDRQRWCVALHNRGLVAFDKGDLRLAEERIGEALAIAREIGDPRSACYALADLAHLHVASGEVERARPEADEALATALRMPVPTLVALALDAEAVIVASAGRPLDAARLWGAAEALRESTGEWPGVADGRRLERSVAAARACVTPEDWARAWHEGRRQGPRDAVSSVLGPDAARLPAAVS